MTDKKNDFKPRRNFDFNEALSEKAKGIFKDASVIPPLKEAEIVIEKFIKTELNDSSGSLRRVLLRRITTNTSLLAQNLNNPLIALKSTVELILSKDSRLYEFVREVDQLYGEMYGERPLFQVPGGKAHPDDEYTHQSVELALKNLLSKL